MLHLRIIPMLFLLAIIASAQESTPVNLQQKPQVLSQPIGEAAFTVPAGSFKDFRFTIPSGVKKVGLFGKFAATGGMRNSIEVWVMNDDQFVNWRNQHKVTPLYNSEKVTQSTIKLLLPTDAGTYHVIFNNAFSILTPKAVESKLVVEYLK